MLKKILISILPVALLASCASFDDFRDDVAQFVETEERATRPDRVRVETRFIGIPDELYSEESCPPPISLTPQDIARIETEAEYNELFVAPLYANNETCYLGMRRIERFTERNTDQPTDEKATQNPQP